jgi:tRNA threonylcarbamoyladenosine biosynthesis protein TsaE
MQTIINPSLNNIPNLAKTVAAGIRGGEIFALMGNLGSGKTTFVQKIAKKLSIRHKITSPTFSLLNCFPGKLKTGKKIMVYHMDIYRTANFKEVKALGLAEFWGQPNTVTFIEWADKIKKHLPKNAVIIKFLHS